jgi:HD-GYP domain-containing protein (c-di-GMP phosphodiesterase class II)
MEEKKIVTIPVSELAPGMTAARDVYSKNDQLLIGANSKFDANSIAKVTFFDIMTVEIIVDENETVDHQKEELTFVNEAEKETFEKFNAQYKESIVDIKDKMNQLLTVGDDINEESLVTHVKGIVSTTGNNYHVFDMLSNIKDFDDETFNHSVNVSMICTVFGEWLGFSEEEKKELTLCGLLHDFGKLLIDKNILKKPGKLTDDEYAVIKAHPQKGYDFLKDKNVSENVKLSCLEHHERCDGSGYPNKIKVDKINKYAAIVSIADVYDAMTSTRVYRKGLSPFRVIKLFEEEGRQQFNPTYLMPILTNLTETYLRHEVLLSDGRKGMIVMINRNELSRPIVMVGNEAVDLMKERNLTIEAVY